MDELENFFTDINYKFDIIPVERGVNLGRLRPIIKTEDDQGREREVADTTEYAYKHENEERKRLQQVSELHCSAFYCIILHVAIISIHF